MLIVSRHAPKVNSFFQKIRKEFPDSYMAR
nr:MAG TPA: hypothetical protein [Caudoviricetes sp.]